MPAGTGIRPSQRQAPHDRLWTAVDRLVDRAPRISDLRCHGLHLLAARRWQQLGRPLPPGLLAEQRAVALMTLLAAHTLDAARDACEEPLVLMKGPELAARYPDAALRPLRDVDVLVADAPGTQGALLAAGFEPVGVPSRYEGIHHLRPLRLPGYPLVIEVHARPKWVGGIPLPDVEELLVAAVPATCGVEGILTLSPEHHAVVLAAHSWAHVPLSRLSHLVDLATLLPETESTRLEEIAARWRLDRVWRTTRAATEWVLDPGAPGSGVPLWARNLQGVRERTVLEAHLERCFSAFWALPPRQAGRRARARLYGALNPRSGESGATKLRRTAQAARDASARLSDHHRSLDRHGIRFGPPRGEEG